MHAAAKAFLVERTDEAHESGWRGFDLCSAHEAVRIANPSACGALMLSTTAVQAEEITPDYIRIARLRYFKRPMRSTALVWAFGA